MSVRRTVAGSLTGALVASALLATAATSAHAAEPDDTAFTPVASDLIGVGSDTSQHALWSLASAWNAQSPAPAFKVATFAATGGGQITLPSGAIARPNGSGAGKNLLYGTTNNADVDFARSSSALNGPEGDAGLKALPFALDELVLAVSNSTASHAPASLTSEQIVAIYKGEVTNWTQVGGTAGVIEPKIPQGGSGTRSFFEAQLKALNGGATINVSGLAEVQEHDDTLIKNNPNAIVPFSKGRAGLLTSAGSPTLRVESGFVAKRALYNVVRGADLADPKIQAVFGTTGFVCLDEAKELIEAAGFGQLDSEDEGGECGVQTNAATTNFQLNDDTVVEPPAASSTNTTATSPSARRVNLKAVVSPSAAGTVTFRDGSAVVASGVPVVNGVAARSLTSVKPGNHSYAAQFVPANAEAFVGSTDATPAKVLVRTTAAIAESFKSSNKKGARARGAIAVTLSGTTTKATGKVVIKVGSKTVGKGTLKNGKVTITLSKLKKGKNKLVVTFAGNTLAPKVAKKFTITQK